MARRRCRAWSRGGSRHSRKTPQLETRGAREIIRRFRRLRGLLPEGLRPQVGLIEQEDVDEEEDDEEPQNEEEALLLVKAAGRTADAARTAKPQEGAGGWQSVRRETRSRTCAIS